MIITGRRIEKLEDAVARLSSSKPKGSTATIQWRQQDISDLSSTEKFWADLKADGTEVDVLVLNAMQPGQFGMKSGWKKVWAAFETNVLGGLQMCEKFLAQGPIQGKVSEISLDSLSPRRKLFSQN